MTKPESFENLDKWSSEGQGPEIAHTVATAVRSARGRLDLGPEPAYLCTKNATPAVAIANLMDMASVRCGCHLIVVLLRHWLWGKKAGMRGKPERDELVDPQYSHFYESKAGLLARDSMSTSNRVDKSIGHT